jgi:hypothetical protein
MVKGLLAVHRDNGAGGDRLGDYADGSRRILLAFVNLPALDSVRFIAPPLPARAPIACS